MNERLSRKELYVQAIEEAIAQREQLALLARKLAAAEKVIKAGDELREAIGPYSGAGTARRAYDAARREYEEIKT